MKLGDLIRDKRVAANLSLRDVARRIGVSHVRLSEIERGVIVPGIEDRLALALTIPGLTLLDLMGASGGRSSITRIGRQP